MYMYIWRSLTKFPNLNPPILLQFQFVAQLLNLILANISRYTVYLTLFPDPFEEDRGDEAIIEAMHTATHLLVCVVLSNPDHR